MGPGWSSRSGRRSLDRWRRGERMSVYKAIVDWRLAEGEDFVAGRYSRAHMMTFDEGLTVPGSASPHVVRAPYSVEAAVDPEEAFVASLSACHMLWFLHLAKDA